MNGSGQAERWTEERVLGALALVCYSTALTAVAGFGYALFALALRAFGPDFACLLTP